MRDKFHAGGMGLKAAKGKAARIYNAAHPGSPVTGHHKKQAMDSLKRAKP